MNIKAVLMILSGICWSIVYIELIRGGFKDKTYSMPLFALGLNFAWELIYSVDQLFLGSDPIQGWVNLVWTMLDAIIIVTYFKYGREYFPIKAKKYFVMFSILAFMSCFVIQFAFYFHFKSVPASQYSAFAQNAAMSIMFLVMLYQRGNTRGQSMLMAVAKWIGTLAPTILGGIIESFNIYILLMGIICYIFDVIYIVALHGFKKEESINTIREAL
ncbi:transmembrane-type terpene cyclase [Paratissierella segnis]|nr:hypothetical protein [Paratissierella segnis]